MEELDKDDITILLLVIGLMAVLLIVGGYAFYLENQYNECAERFNNPFGIFEEEKTQQSELELELFEKYIEELKKEK